MNSLIQVNGERSEETEEDLKNSEAEGCMPNADSWNNDIYGMPTITDYKTDPNNPTIVSNSLIGNTLLFHGRRYDKETNLYYYRARYYDPITGRFLSTDPMGYQDSMNLYQAFNMNGVNFLDPMGTIVRWSQMMGQKNVERFSNTDWGAIWNDTRDFRIRAGGVIQAGVGALMVKVAAVITVASEGILSPLGAVLLAKGTDNMQAGARTVVSGENTPTLFYSGAKEVSKLMTDNPDTQNKIATLAEFSTDTGLLFGALRQMIKRATVEIAEPINKSTASDVSSPTKVYGPLNKGPLSNKIAQTFRSGTYKQVTTTKPTTLYRVIGPNNSPTGQYWTRVKPRGPVQAIIDSALDQQWGNIATYQVRMTVPAGTTFYEGVAAVQRGLVGGGNQIFIPKVNPSWINGIVGF